MRQETKQIQRKLVQLQTRHGISGLEGNLEVQPSHFADVKNLILSDVFCITVFKSEARLNYMFLDSKSIFSQYARTSVL